MSLLRRWWFWLSPWMSFGMLLLFLRGHLPIPHCALKHPSDDKKVISKGEKGLFGVWGVKELNIIQFYAFFQLFFCIKSKNRRKSIGIWSILGTAKFMEKRTDHEIKHYIMLLQCVPKGSEHKKNFESNTTIWIVL